MVSKHPKKDTFGKKRSSCSLPPNIEQLIIRRIQSQLYLTVLIILKKQLRSVNMKRWELVKLRSQVWFPVNIGPKSPYLFMLPLLVLYLPGQVRARCRYVCHCAGEWRCPAHCVQGSVHIVPIIPRCTMVPCPFVPIPGGLPTVTQR